MKQKKINRYGHTGKSWQEKIAYRNFLGSETSLDPTVEPVANTEKTNESSFEEEREKTTKIQKKSLRLKINDFWNNNWIITIVAGLFLLIIGGFFSVVMSFNRELGIHNTDISNIKDTLKLLNEHQERFYELKENFGIFKIEIVNDLELIKNNLKIK